MRPEMEQELEAEKVSLEASANRLRARLASTLESLKQRHGDAFDSGAPAAIPVAVTAVASAQGVDLMNAQQEPVETPVQEPDLDVEKTRLESGANRLRRRLARTLESLKQRRKRALDLPYQVKRHPLPLIAAGAGTVLAMATGVGMVIYRAHHRPEPRLADRMSAAVRMWQHPDRVARQGKSSTGKGVLLGMVISLTTYAITQLAKRALHKSALHIA